MKKPYSIILVAVILSFCSANRNEQYFQFKKEITKSLVINFEKFLPTTFVGNAMWKIRFTPSYLAFGCSGIDVLFNLDDYSFDKNVQMLTANDIIPRVVNYESIKIDSSSSEYYSFKTDSVQRIAIPIIQNLFCKDSLTCFSWSDMEVVILEVGKGHLFSKFSDNEFGLNNLISSYSIGALISRQKRQIVYWLYIYQT